MAGFPAATLKFLNGISANNARDWFEAHRADYDAGYRDAGADFVARIGPRLAAISPEVQFAPKVGGSQMRINRDTRFSRDKRPYKDHLDLWFWLGARKGWEGPGFYLRITAATVWIGADQHELPKPALARFRDAVVDPVAGKALEAAVASVGAAGLVLGEAVRKRVPAGYDAAHPRARYLLHESLHAHAEWPAATVEAGDFDDRALAAFAAAWPVGQWLRDWL
jgi:uncharacterized protein (TIGR02453 family)